MDNKLKELISAEYENVYPVGSKMHDYCTKEVSDAVLLENGMIYLFYKPKIETHFCFGYRLSGEDTNDYDEANNMCYHVQNDKGMYFLKENLKQFDNFAEFLKTETIYARFRYYGRTKFCEVYDTRYTLAKEECVYVLTKTDIENLRKVNQSEKEKFTKRLNTYLKKYGTSKLHTWSYWVDA